MNVTHFFRGVLSVSFVSGLVWASSAQAGVCEMQIHRVPCAGKEAESLKKCAGKVDCTVKKKAATAQECSDTALKECENSRLDITKSKTIKAKFDGAELKSKSGDLNFCEANRPDFNKC